MKPQRFASKNESIREQFDRLKSASPDRLEKRLNLSWSNWGFGMEPLAVSAQRLQKAGIKYIELRGNHYGDDLGYPALRLLHSRVEQLDRKDVGLAVLPGIDLQLHGLAAIPSRTPDVITASIRRFITPTRARLKAFWELAVCDGILTAR